MFVSIFKYLLFLHLLMEQVLAHNLCSCNDETNDETKDETKEEIKSEKEKELTQRIVIESDEEIGTDTDSDSEENEDEEDSEEFNTDSLCAGMLTKQMKIIFKKCKEFTFDDTYVYKLCRNVHTKGKFNKWLVILRKLDGTLFLTGKDKDMKPIDQKRIITKTNEGRKNVINKHYAKFRADKLKVIKIINIFDVNYEKDYIVTKYKEYPEIEYKIGNIVESKTYDDNIDNIRSGGIHYYKTISAAYFFRRVPDDYTGSWFTWYDDGKQKSFSSYSNGSTWYFSR